FKSARSTPTGTRSTPIWERGWPKAWVCRSPRSSPRRLAVNSRSYEGARRVQGRPGPGHPGAGACHEAKDQLGSRALDALESSCPGFQGSASVGAQQPARLKLELTRTMPRVLTISYCQAYVRLSV